MKRYLLFLYKSNDPKGGWNDFEGAYDHRTQAENHAHSLSEVNKNLCFQIYDLKTCQLVACKEEQMGVSQVNKERAPYWTSLNRSK
jgi:hypothetical protein